MAGEQVARDSRWRSLDGLSAEHHEDQLAENDNAREALGSGTYIVRQEASEDHSLYPASLSLQALYARYDLMEGMGG
jgi:hypothetical protein